MASRWHGGSGGCCCGGGGGAAGVGGGLVGGALLGAGGSVVVTAGCVVVGRPGWVVLVGGDVGRVTGVVVGGGGTIAPGGATIVIVGAGVVGGGRLAWDEPAALSKTPTTAADVAATVANRLRLLDVEARVTVITCHLQCEHVLRPEDAHGPRSRKS